MVSIVILNIRIYAVKSFQKFEFIQELIVRSSFVWSTITVVVSRLVLELLLAKGQEGPTETGRATIEYEVYYHSDWPDQNENCPDRSTTHTSFMMTPLSADPFLLSASANER